MWQKNIKGGQAMIKELLSNIFGKNNNAKESIQDNVVNVSYNPYRIDNSAIDKIYDSLPKMSQQDDIAYTINGQELNGINEKTFHHVPSIFVMGLIDTLNSGDSNYVTYSNDTVMAMDDISTIPVVDKHLRYAKKDAIDALTEVFASRLLNRMGRPTVYNSIAVDPNDAERPYHLLSTNFLPDGHKFYTFEDCKVCFSALYPIWEQYNSCELNNFIFDYNMSYRNINNQSVQKEAISTFIDIIKGVTIDELDRRYIMGDNDYAGHNAGVIEDTTNRTLRLAPNFDMEYCFGKCIGDPEPILRFLNKHWPEELKSHIDTVNEIMTVDGKFTHNSEACKIIRSNAGDDISLTLDVENNLIDNYRNVASCYYQDICKTQEM